MWLPFFNNWSLNPDEGFIGPIQPGHQDYLTPDKKPPEGYDSWTDYAISQGGVQEQSEDFFKEESILDIFNLKQNEENGFNPFLAKIEFYFIAILGLWAYSSYKK